MGQLARALPASYPVLVHRLASLLRASFQAPPRGECYFTLALRYHFTSITCEEDLHLLAVEHARHTKKNGRRSLSARCQFWV
jgi:hypothetical protein